MSEKTTILTRLDQADRTDYQPVPFWSWNDRLEPDELRRQIRAMKKAGMGGFFMHARGGLETEYLSDDWFAAVDASVDEAEKQHMNAWCYDENGWPSGFVGGKLLEDPANWVHYLQMTRGCVFDPDALAVYVTDGTKLRRVMEPTGAAEYICIYDRTNASAVDILNPQVMDRFLAETHDRYYAKFGNAFGRTLKGFFTDEPQYFRYDTAYTPVMQAEYRKRYGDDLLDGLGALFVDCDGAKGFRFRYWRLMNELYTEHFAGRIYRWCEAHRSMLTGHSIDENSLGGQMMCSAGVMPFYEYEHIPGIDWLGRSISSEMAPKQVASVSQQLGKKHVLTETFACVGWDVTPKELKRIAEWQYVNGVNLMCHHLYPYSIRGQRKRDYPAFYSEHNPWTDELHRFNEYFTNLGYLLAESREKADVAIIHPMHSAYLTFDRNRMAESTGELNARFVELIERFGAAGIGHHYVDESLLAKYGSVQDGALKMGLCQYRCVVIPEMESLDHTTVDLLRDYAAQGGTIWLAGKAPERVDGELADLSFLQSNTTFEAIARRESPFDRWDSAVRCTYRRAEGGDFLYAVNLSEDRTESLTLTLPFDGAVRFDPMTKKCAPLYFEKTADGLRVPVTMKPGDAVILMQDDAAVCAPGPRAVVETKPLMGRMTMVQPVENSLTIDTVALSDDGVHYSDVLPVMAASDRLLRERRNRPIWVKYTFDADYVPETLLLETERTAGMEITVNGMPAEMNRPGTLDASFRRGDIAPLTHAGRNEIVLHFDYRQPEHVYEVFNGFYYGTGEVTETLMNCLSFETDIEAVYLAGDFAVAAKHGYRNGVRDTRIADAFVLTEPVRAVDSGDITVQGFPFFHGPMTLRTTVNLTGSDWTLRVNGRYQYAKVWVNGEYAGLLLFDDTCDLSGLLHPGENTIELQLMSSNRNLFGPFHTKGDPEPYGVSPSLFALYGTWNEDGTSAKYDPDYAMVRFGLYECRLER